MNKIILTLLSVFLLMGVAQARAASLDSIIQQPDKWLNTTRPLSAGDFQGKAVLLDFWTYGCINCMQIVPDLSYLEEKFGNKLLIVGVHSAKFQGEQGNERILFAAKRFGLKHPVFNDADFAVWNSFDIKAWPTQVLLGPDGQEVGRWSGEGHRNDIEKAVAGLNVTSDQAAPLSKQEDKTTLSFPARIVANGQSFIIADTGHNRILLTDKTGKIIDKIGAGEKGLKDGDYTAAQFNSPRGVVAIDDKIYVADTGNHALREIDLKAKTVSTLAGNGERGQEGQLASPWDVANNDGNLVIANAGTHQLLSYNLKDKKLSVLAGTGREDIKDGAALDAALAQPSALSIVDKTIYFVDAESSALRQLKDGQVKTLIGTGLFDFGLKDGKYPEAKLQHPQGLFANPEMIFIADTYNNAIRFYEIKTGQLKTTNIDSSQLNEPGSVIIFNGYSYIANTNNNEISRVRMTSKVLEPFIH